MPEPPTPDRADHAAAKPKVLGSPTSDAPTSTSPPSRRRVFGLLTTVGAAVGLTTAYGTLAALMGRFLFPARKPDKGWMFVTQERRLKQGDSLLYQTPAGATVNVARQGRGTETKDFVALSSTCPHLGCQVHWEPQNDRFFCPCHNGVFSPDGTGISGPPGDAGQSLPRYPLKVDRGLLFIEVSQAEIAMGPGRVLPAAVPTGPGHDPCLSPCPCDAPVETVRA